VEKNIVRIEHILLLFWMLTLNLLFLSSRNAAHALTVKPKQDLDPDLAENIQQTVDLPLRD